MRNKTIKSIIAPAVALITFTAITFSGCSGKNQNSKNQSSGEATRIIVGEANTYYPLVEVALAKGFFAEELPGVEIVHADGFSGGPALMEGIQAGQIDIAQMVDQPVLSAVANNRANVKIVANVGIGARNLNIFVSEKSGIKTGYDLKGKKIATQFATGSHKFLLTYLTAFGLDEDSVELVNLKDKDVIFAAISKGEIDGAVSTIDAKSQFEELGAFILSSADGYIKNSLLFAARTEFIEKNPETTAGFLRALEKGINYLHENPEESIQIKANVIDGATEKTLKFERAHFNAFDYVLSFDESDFEEYQRTADFGYKNGSFRSLVDVSTVVDDTYYKAAFNK